MLTNLVKVVSGDSPDRLERVAKLHERVIKPGVLRCGSIKATEACKVIENTQRDLNVALMYELAIIFDLVWLDTSEMLQAGGMKWNFLKFKPGLVGGHCIGVDPYYLPHKAYIKGARVNVLGLTSKENCANLRNSKVGDVIRELRSYGVEVWVHDPHADPIEARHEHGASLVQWSDLPRADALVLAVSHANFLDLGVEDLSRELIRGGCVIDVKSAFAPEPLRAAGFSVRRLQPPAELRGFAVAATPRLSAPSRYSVAE